MSQHQVVVVFDVSAPGRLKAAEAIAFALGRDGLCDLLRDHVEGYGISGQTALESWWFPEADLKAVDRNDNGAFRLVTDNRLEAQDCTAIRIDDLGATVYGCIRPFPHHEHEDSTGHCWHGNAAVSG